MSIQSEITRIANAKTAIESAITAKGITVPTGTLIGGLASLIGGIPSASNVKCGVGLSCTMRKSSTSSTTSSVTFSLGMNAYARDEMEDISIVKAFLVYGVKSARTTSTPSWYTNYTYPTSVNIDTLRNVTSLTTKYSYSDGTRFGCTGSSLQLTVRDATSASAGYQFAGLSEIMVVLYTVNAS